MIEYRPTNPPLKPDYPKIIFVAVPLFFIVWCFLLICLSLLCHDMSISFYGSIVLTLLFAVVYFHVTVRRMSWFKTGAIDDGTKPIASNDPSRRTVSTQEAIKAGILVFGLLCGFALSELVFEIPSEKILRVLVPIATVAGLAGKYLRKRKRKRDNQVKMEKAMKPYRLIEP